jgi:hypothetical protein
VFFAVTFNLVIRAALPPNNAIKGDPVQRTWSMPANGLAMAGGCIAFVGGKSVLREYFVIFTHQAVAVDLGDYRSGGNGNRKAVTLHNALLLYWKREFIRAVDEEEIRPCFQTTDSARHGSKGCLEDIYPIYFDVIYNPDSDGQGTRPDFQVKFFPLLSGELLGIGDPGETNTLGQDYGSGYHGAGQRPPAGLIYSANKTKAPPVGLSFMKAHINRQGFDQLPLHEIRLGSF